MKNRFLPFSLITTFLGLSIVFFFVFSVAGQTGDPDSRKFAGSGWESIRANQHTGVVNPHDVFNARQQADALRVKSTSSMGLNWLSLGPDNFPGMFWSTIFDNTDPSGSTIIAGSAKGGIWKSADLGLTWSKMPVALNLVPSVSSLVQTSSGTIYAATGVSTCKTIKFTGNGIYRGTPNGEFSPITSTMGNPDFYGVTKLAVNAQSGRIFAATVGGLYYSDNGDSWEKAISGYAMDVVVGPDGTVIMSVGDSAYIAPSGDLNAKVTLTTGKANSLPNAGFGWIVFAIAPSDANVIYASLADAAGKLLNIYTSFDKGLTWSIVFPNNPSFEPFSGYGCYANTLVVLPNDPYKVYLGGVNMWYGQRVLSTGFFNWEQVSFGNEGSLSPTFAPLYHHGYVFRPNNPNQFAMATDGGVSIATIGAVDVTFQTSNKNLQTSQFNSVAFSALRAYAMGGGDRIGTLVLGYFAPSQVSFPSNGYQVFRQDASALSSAYQPQPSNYCGTGGTCVWSNIDSRVAVYTKYKGDSTANIPFKAIRRQDFTDINKYNYFLGGVVDTVSSAHVPMCLWETFKQGEVFGVTRDSVKYHAEQKAVPADTTILVPSNSNKVPFAYHTTAPIPKGDSLTIADPLASRYFIYGKSGTNRCIFMTLNLLRFDRAIDYYTIFKDVVTNDPVTAIAVSADLNTLWAGTSLGRLIRITGLVNAYDSATANIASSQCVLQDTVFSTTPFTGRHVTSISIDPGQSNKVLVTLGNYGNQNYVYYAANGNSTSPVFNSIQGNLPLTPVFSGLIEMHGNSVILGTDMGLFSGSGLESGAPAWAADMENIGNVPVTDVRQQIMHDYHIQNYGVIYISTYGRGIWMDTTYYSPVGIDPGPGAMPASGMLRLNPNPVQDILYISYSNETMGNLNISVYDLSGRLLINKPLGSQEKGTFNTSINLSGLSHGTYLVKVGTGYGKIVKL